MAENTPENFEKALEELQVTVKALESGHLSLEDSLKSFEKGVRLSRQCQEYLAKAQKRIEILTDVGNRGVTLKPFDGSETPDRNP